jgi:3-dehydroquinate synthase
MKTVSVKLNQIQFSYDISIEHDSLTSCGNWARNCLLQTTKKIAIVSNRKVFGLYGETVKRNFEAAGFESPVFLMKDGERYKNLRSLEETLRFFSENKLTRTDSVAALGGGVVGDLAGFASAIFLRGVQFLQIPTTLLAMIDSSVGGKTGVNSAFGKNLIGAFQQPSGVLIDVKTLQTLPRRELTSGFCEAIKQGVLADKKLFHQTDGFLEMFSPYRFKKYFEDEYFLAELERLIAAQIAFKAEIVMQDERENAGRIDAKSRKILNFGHTLAHALEKVTDYKRFKHGEAVGWGILFAASLSKRLDIFDSNELNLLNDVVHRSGSLPNLGDIDVEKVIEAFAFDKKSIENSLQWILLKGIGDPVIYKNEEIPHAILRTTLKDFLSG